MTASPVSMKRYVFDSVTEVRAYVTKDALRHLCNEIAGYLERPEVQEPIRISIQVAQDVVETVGCLKVIDSRGQLIAGTPEIVSSD